MSFPRYPKYKDSGVEWLGEVPEHWEVRRLKTMVGEPLKYGANESAELDDPALPRFVRITDIDEFGRLRDDTFKSLPAELAEPYLLQEGDVLLARSGATVGKSFIYSPQWGTACFAGYLIRARLTRMACLPRWLSFFCQTGSYWGYVVGSQIQATIQNVSAEKYANLRLPLPCIAEQARIVSFLDRETGRIDGLVAEQQRLMGLLKEKRQAVISHAVTKGLNPHAPMKPSGVEWLGDVPTHWRTGKCGFYLTVLPGFAFPSEGFVADETETKLLRGVNVGVSCLKWDDTAYWRRTPDDGLNHYELRDGDLVIGMDRPLISDGVRVAKVKASDLPCLLLQRVASLKPGDRLNSDYLMYLLCSEMFAAHFSPETTGVSVPHISPRQIQDFVIPVPPLEEQDGIVSFIRANTEVFDTLTAQAQKAIDLLQERRTALISAAVTGQIDVRELAVS